MATFRIKRKRNERVDPSSIMHHLCFFCGEMFTVLSDYQRHLVDHQMIGISHQLYLEEIATKKKQRKNRLQSAAAPINGRRHTIATTAPNDAPSEVKDKQRDVRPLDRAESKSRHAKDKQPNKEEYYANSMDIDPAPQVEQQQPSRRAHSKLAEPQPVMSKESQNPGIAILSTGNAETLKPHSSASSRASQSPQTTQAQVSKPEKEKPRKTSPPLHTTSEATDLAGSSVSKSAVMSEPAKVASSPPPASTSGPNGNQPLPLPVPAPAPTSSYYFAPPTLPQHSATDPVRPVSARCEQCQSEFDKKTQLVQHLVNMHGWDVDSMMLNPFSGAESRDPRAVPEEEVCVECTLEFNTPTRYFLHLLLVHKDTLFYEDDWTKILLDVHLRKATSTMVVELSLTLSAV